MTYEEKPPQYTCVANLQPALSKSTLSGFGLLCFMVRVDFGGLKMYLLAILGRSCFSESGSYQSSCPPIPSAPSALSPIPHSWPLLVKISVCLSPHATSHTLPLVLLPSRDTSGSGILLHSGDNFSRDCFARLRPFFLSLPLYLNLLVDGQKHRP